MKLLIYDDNAADISDLKAIIRELLGDFTDIDTASDAEAARSMLAASRYDAAFLDIELGRDQSGIDFAEELRRVRPDIGLVFITAHIKYAEEIFVASPDALVVKPFTEESVRRSLEILAKKRENREPTALVLGRRNPERIELDKISYIETSSRNLCFYDSSYELVHKFFDIKIDQISDRLPRYFVWCHKSFCVNMNYVGRLERFKFLLKDGPEIPISQNRYSETKSRFLHFLEDEL